MPLLRRMLPQVSLSRIQRYTLAPYRAATAAVAGATRRLLVTSMAPTTKSNASAPPSPIKKPTLLLLLTISPGERTTTTSLRKSFERCISALAEEDKCGQVFVHHLPGLLVDSDKLPDHVQTPAVPDSINAQKTLHVAAAAAKIDLNILLAGLKSGVDPFPQAGAMPPFQKAFIGPDGVNCNLLKAYQEQLELDSLHQLVVDQKSCDEDDDMHSQIDSGDDLTCDEVVLGGTFDRLHAGHKILLAEAVTRCRRRLTIGVTEGSMLVKKTLSELIEPCHDRIDSLTRYLKNCDPNLQLNIVPITDMYGPSIEMAELGMIVGSEETAKGCQMINEKRLERGLSSLEIRLVKCIPDLNREDSKVEEDKISSSSARKRLLGSRLKSPLRPWLPKEGRPYIIGLTGTSASGKSSIGKHLAALGAGVVDCDRLGHLAYAKGSQCLTRVAEAFGENIIGADGAVDRRILGSLVFGNKENQDKLESIVWPEILLLAKSEIARLHEEEGKAVIVLDAAVLLRAGWHEDLCHEVWGCIIPQDEAIKRIVERDGKSEEEAAKRLAAGATNAEIVAESSVIFCTQWAVDYTKRQVRKAWEELGELMSKARE